MNVWPEWDSVGKKIEHRSLYIWRFRFFLSSIVIVWYGYYLYCVFILIACRNITIRYAIKQNRTVCFEGTIHPLSAVWQPLKMHKSYMYARVSCINNQLVAYKSDYLCLLSMATPSIQKRPPAIHLSKYIFPISAMMDLMTCSDDVIIRSARRQFLLVWRIKPPC